MRGAPLPSMGPNQEKGTAVMGLNPRAQWRHAMGLEWA